MKIPESGSKSYIGIILSFPSTKNTTCSSKSLHSTNSILYNNTNTWDTMILFFLIFCERVLFGSFLGDIGILVNMLYSLKSTIYKNIHSLWNEVNDMIFINLLFIMNTPMFRRRDIEDLLVFVWHDRILSSWSFLFSWVVFCLCFWFLSSDGWSFHSINHHFFDFWKQSKKFLRSRYLTNRKWESTIESFWKERKKGLWPKRGRTLGRCKNISSKITCRIRLEKEEDEKKFLLWGSDMSCTTSSYSSYTSRISLLYMLKQYLFKYRKQGIKLWNSHTSYGTKDSLIFPGSRDVHRSKHKNIL